MTQQDIEQLIEFVLDLASALNMKINYNQIDFNEQKFCTKATDLQPLFKNIEEIISEEQIDQETWDYCCTYLEKNYNLKLNTADIVLDEILITGKTLLGLSAANFRKIENETE